MIYTIHKKLTKSIITLAVMAGLLLNVTPAALASDGPKNGEAADAKGLSLPDSAAPSGNSESGAGTQPLSLSYGGLKLQPEPAPVPTPVAVKLNLPTSQKIPQMQAFPSLPLPRASTAPMTAGEKFDYFVKSSFMPPGPYAVSIASGLWNELLDNNEGKKDTLDDYFADAATRAVRSFGNRIANNFFEKFAYATILKQDPRYHRSQKKGLGARVGYALSRLVITQGDRSGDQVNISFLAGGLTGAAVSTPWQRRDKRDVGDVFKRWGNHIAIRGLTNILTEFLGGQ